MLGLHLVPDVCRWATHSKPLATVWRLILFDCAAFTIVNGRRNVQPMRWVFRVFAVRVAYSNSDVLPLWEPVSMV